MDAACGTRDVGFLIQNYGSEYTNFTVADTTRVFQEGAVIDFRVKAFIGFEAWGFVATFPYRIINGEDSGWSNTLTVTISKDATSSDTYATTIDGSLYPTLTSPQTLPTPTATSLTSPTPVSPSPTVPEFPILVILTFFVTMLVLQFTLSIEGPNHESC